jgi:tRNA (guanine37-N1)-methyltransferase
MKIDILTLFPEMFEGPFKESIIKIAQEKGLVEINIHNLRDWAKGKHNQVDDKPYGGGKGMVLMIEPIYDALGDLKTKDSKVILLSPQGKVFNQKKAISLSKEKHIILIAGHYEGVDERVRKHLIDEEISIGDYVLTGGELPAMVVTETVLRLVPGVLEEEATSKDSFFEIEGQKLLEYPQYTRPADFKGWKVEEILMSGDHKKINKWQEEKALEKTKKVRPDLLKDA